MKISFAVIKVRAHKKGKCGLCGKPIVKTKTFENTVNPWNQNDDGSIRTEDEIIVHLRKHALAWQQSEEFCKQCQQATAPDRKTGGP